MKYEELTLLEQLYKIHEDRQDAKLEAERRRRRLAERESQEN